MKPLDSVWLFVRAPDFLTAGQVIGWWELRRAAYNLVVGATGLITCVIAMAAGSIVESRGGEAIFPNPPIFAVLGIVLYGIAANIGYTAGWICELIARRIWPAESASFGRLSFIFGLGGSVALTLLPAALITILSVAVIL